LGPLTVEFPEASGGFADHETRVGGELAAGEGGGTETAANLEVVLQQIDVAKDDRGDFGWGGEADGVELPEQLAEERDLVLEIPGADDLVQGEA
jgi:hypothetical protein